MNKNTLLSMIAACSLIMISFQVTADTVTLNPDHPNRYTVVEGDTLWDISSRFLKDPWLWPDIWNVNPAIENPHLIFPGDVILLQMVDGQPVLTLERGQRLSDNQSKRLSTRTAEGLGIVRLSPSVRASKLTEKAIPVIPNSAIKQFLQYPRIISERELDQSGYLVASEDKGLISASNDKVYARAIEPNEQTQYDILRMGKTYKRDDTWGSEILGYEMLRVANAKITRYGDPATLVISSANREVFVGDRLLPAIEEREMTMNYLPHPPENIVTGKIISVLDGVSRIGQFQTVVIDLGERDNIEAGHVLAINTAGETIRDPVTSSWNNRVTLPDERSGTLMIIRPFERVSYALVMEAYKDMKVFDTVTNP